MMPDSFFKSVYELLLSYGEVPKTRILKAWRRASTGGSYHYSIVDQDNFVWLCRLLHCPSEFTCNTIAFRCDKTGYCYVFEDTKRHPKTAPISEINKQIQSLREKYLTLPAFW